MNPIVKNILILLAFTLMVGHIAQAEAKGYRPNYLFDPIVQCMINNRTVCTVC